jgi:hypothetical protein
VFAGLDKRQDNALVLRPGRQLAQGCCHIE